MFTALGLGVVSAAELFNVTETEEPEAVPAVRSQARLGSSWGLPQSMFFKLSLGEPFWMKDSFNNFISDPFLPTKPLF